MAAVEPTGRVVRDSEGLEVIISRRIVAPIAEVWEWMTASPRTQSWIGSWEGKPGTGSTIQFLMTAEGMEEAEDVLIVECAAPRRLLVEMGRPGEQWRVGVSLVEISNVTTVFLTQRVATVADAGSYAPGWEYYLDRMIAARSGGTPPEFVDYFPIQSAYYERLAYSTDIQAGHSLGA